MTDEKPTRRFSPTPAWLIFGLLVVEGLLWLSERFQWFWFNEKKGWTALIAVAAVGGAMLVMLGWFVASLLFRWRFQFSIRSLLVLTVAVAVPSSWLAVETRVAKMQEEAVAAIRELGSSVDYDWQVDANGRALQNAQPPEPAWLRNLLGDDFFEAVVDANLKETDITDAGLAHLAELTQLRSLSLNDTQIADAGLAHLVGLTQLQWLDLNGTRITDAGLAHLVGLTQLKELGLDKTRITDAGLAHVARLTQLKKLGLYNANITDAGLPHLVGLNQLEYLDLVDTQSHG